MGIVPKGRRSRIAWYKGRIADWARDPQGIGLSADDIAEMQSKIDAAWQAQVDQAGAQRAARSATLRMNSAIKAMSKAGSGMIKRIQAAASMNGFSPEAKASIPARRGHSTIGPPGRPHSIRAALEQCGWLTLKWKCDNPRGAEGTQYQIYRRLDDRGALLYLGAAGKKKFIDRTVPRGTSSALYQIQAIRTTCVGEVALFPMRFGSVVQQPVKVAPARAA